MKEDGKVEEPGRERELVLLLLLLLLLPLAATTANGGLRGCRFCAGRGTLASEVGESESFEEAREREEIVKKRKVEKKKVEKLSLFFSLLPRSPLRTRSS